MITVCGRHQCVLQVKNFCNEHVESEKLGSAIGKYQTAEYTMVISFNVISLLQGTIVFAATVLGLVLCVKVSTLACSSCSGEHLVDTPWQ